MPVVQSIGLHSHCRQRDMALWPCRGIFRLCCLQVDSILGKGTHMVTRALSLWRSARQQQRTARDFGPVMGRHAHICAREFAFHLMGFGQALYATHGDADKLARFCCSAARRILDRSAAMEGHGPDATRDAAGYTRPLRPDFYA